MAHSRDLSTCVAAGCGMAWGPLSLSRGVLGRRSSLGLKGVIALGLESQKLVVPSSGREDIAITG